MTVAWTSVNNHQVACDHADTWRWFDVVGPGAAKWTFDASKVVSTTTAAGATVTQTNGTLVTTDSTTGGAVRLTVGGADNDKVQIQSFSELYKFAARWPAYFGCKVSLVDASESDLHAGFIIRDTDFSDGVSDGIYFRVADGSAVVSLVLEQDSAETTVELFTAVDATAYTLELYIDSDYVYAYVNGALATSVACSNANFCNDEDLCATIGQQAGAGAANHATLYWLRALQVQEA